MINFILTCGVLTLYATVLVSITLLLMNARRIIKAIKGFIDWHTRK